MHGMPASKQMPNLRPACTCRQPGRPGGVGGRDRRRCMRHCGGPLSHQRCLMSCCCVCTQRPALPGLHRRPLPSARRARAARLVCPRRLSSRRAAAHPPLAQLRRAAGAFWNHALLYNHIFAPSGTQARAVSSWLPAGARACACPSERALLVLIPCRPLRLLLPCLVLACLPCCCPPTLPPAPARPPPLPCSPGRPTRRRS